MSAQGAKKKKFGSRRRVANQNKEVVEFQVTESSSLAQCHIPEENVESVNALANPGHSESETQIPPLHQLGGNRRKLGSSRKRGQRVNYSATELGHEPREEVEATQCDETTETLLAIQHEKQEELGHDCENVHVCATHVSSLYSAAKPDYSSEVQNFTLTSGSEADLQSLISKSTNLKADQNENKTDSEVVSDAGKLMKSDANSARGEQSAHIVGISEFTSFLSSPTVHQHLIDQSNSKDNPGDEFPSVYSVTIKESKTRDEDTDLLRQDENIQVKFLMSESHVKSLDEEFSITPENITEKGSPEEHNVYDVGQATFSSSKGQLFANEEQKRNFNKSLVRDDQHSEDVVNKTHEQKIHDNSENVTYDSIENSELISGNPKDQAEVSETYQFELIATSTEDSNPDDKVMNKQEMEGTLSKGENCKSYLETLQLVMNPPLHSKPQDNYLTTEEQTHDFNPIGNRRKIGSSRRSKGQPVMDCFSEMHHKQKEEVVENTKVHEALEKTPMLLAIERTSEEELSQGSEHDIDMPVTHESSVYSAIMPGNSSEVQNPTTTNCPEAELDILIPKSENLQKDHGVVETDFKEEVSDKSVEATLEGLDKSDFLHSPEVTGRNHSVEVVNKVHDQEDKPAKIQEITQTDPSFKSAINYATGKCENPSGNPIDQFEVSYEMIERITRESATKLEDAYPDCKQNDNPTKADNFEALGHIKEDYHAHDKKKTSVSDTVRVDTALCQVYENKGQVEDKFDTVQTKEVCDQVASAHGGISEHSSLTVQSINQSKSTEKPHKLPNMYSETEKENRGRNEDTKLSRQDENVQDNYVVNESNDKLGDEDVFITTEITIEKSRPGEHTESECSDEQAILSSSPEEEYSHILEVKDAQHSEDAVTKLHEQELKPAQMQDIDYSSKSVKHDTTENSKLISENQKDQAEVTDLHQFELVAKRTGDSATKQQYSNPYVKVMDKQEKEGTLGEVEQSQFFLEILQSGMNPPLNSEPQDNSLTNEKQTHTDLNPIRNRRKIGSSRRNKGRQKAMEAFAESNHELKEGVWENTTIHEALDTTQMSFAKERTSQEELGQGSEHDILIPVIHESSFYSAIMPAHSSEDKNPTLSRRNCPEAKLETLIPKSENLQNDHGVGATDFKAEVADKSVISTLEGLDKFDTVHSQEVRGAHHSEDVVNKVHDQEVKPAKIQEMSQTDAFFENAMHDVKGKAENNNGNLIDQSEISDIYQSEITERSAHESATKLEVDVAESFYRPAGHVVGNIYGDEPLKDTKVILKISTALQEKSMETMLEGMEKCDTAQTDDYGDNVPLDALVQDVFQVHNTAASSSDKEMNTQHIHDAIQTVGGVTIEDKNTEAQRPMDVRVVKQFEGSEKLRDHMAKEREAQKMNASQELTHAGLFSAAHNNIDSLTPFDIGCMENFRADPVVDVSEESGITTTVGAGNSQQGIQEQIHFDNSTNVQGKSKQKRRKMGSTRRTQLNRKPEGGLDDKDKTNERDSDIEPNMINSDKMEVVEELPMILTAEVSHDENEKLFIGAVYKEQQETSEISSVHNRRQKLQSSTSNPLIQINTFSGINELKALLPEECASQNEEVINLDKFVQVAYVRDCDRHIDVIVKPDDITGTEMHTTSVLSGNTEDTPNSGILGGSVVSLFDTKQSMQNEEKIQWSFDTKQDKALKSAEAPVVAVSDFKIAKFELRGDDREEHEHDKTGTQQQQNDVNKGAHNTNAGMKNASPKLNSPNRRRKLGSTRKNLESRIKTEDLHQKQDEANEATENATNVATLLHNYTVESHKSPAHHNLEENPVSHGQQLETEHQLTHYFPTMPSTSPKHDVMSESASGRRKRKMGSHRKSHGHKHNENQTAREDRIPASEYKREVGHITEEGAIKATEGEYLGLDKILEVEGSDNKESSNIYTSKAGVLSRPVSERTPVQPPFAEIRLVQDSQKLFSLAGNPQEDHGSNSYNVVMVGDSSVGKTSYMRRAQSGKFSLDLPASLGLDSCIWTVLVDGKPVVLKLWDTAGQERFHSITRQIFHKAQAFILMYDITSTQSFSAVSYWASCIKEGAADNLTIFLLGNKSDHADRQVTTQDGETLAKEYNFEFKECSAATGENVIECLEAMARILIQTDDMREEGMVLHKEISPQKKSSGCC